MAIKPAPNFRKFEGETYVLSTNEFGINLKDAQESKKLLRNKVKGVKVRIVWNGSYPNIYPEGRFYVYMSGQPLLSPKEKILSWVEDQLVNNDHIANISFLNQLHA